MCRVGKWQWVPRAAAAVESSHFLDVCRPAKQTLCQNEISWCDSSTPSSNWAPFLFPCTHPIWAWHAPAVRWQLTIASSPLINCWNDTPSHKQCIILQASETLQSAIVGAKYASTYHSKQVESAVGYWVCWGWKEEACVWHVNSNQGSDIHQAPWPTVKINLGREDSQALFFVSASICRFLSRFSPRSLSLSSCFLLFIYLPLALLSHTLSSTLSLSVCFLLSPPLYPLCFLSLCLSSSCNKSALLFGGR